MARRKACSARKILLICLVVILLGGLAATLTILLWPDEIHEEEVDGKPSNPNINGDGNKPEEPKILDDGKDPKDPQIGGGISPYPNCHVAHPEYIADGGCDGGQYNTAECGWDGGDCLDLTNAIQTVMLNTPLTLEMMNVMGLTIIPRSVGGTGGIVWHSIESIPIVTLNIPVGLVTGNVTVASTM